MVDGHAGFGAIEIGTSGGHGAPFGAGADACAGEIFGQGALDFGEVGGAWFGDEGGEGKLLNHGSGGNRNADLGAGGCGVEFGFGDAEGIFLPGEGERNPGSGGAIGGDASGFELDVHGGVGACDFEHGADAGGLEGCIEDGGDVVIVLEGIIFCDIGAEDAGFGDIGACHLFLRGRFARASREEQSGRGEGEGF